MREELTYYTSRAIGRRRPEKSLKRTTDGSAIDGDNSNDSWRNVEAYWHEVCKRPIYMKYAGGLRKRTLKINIAACLAIAWGDGRTEIAIIAIAKEIIVAQWLGCQGSFRACLLIILKRCLAIQLVHKRQGKQKFSTRSLLPWAGRGYTHSARWKLPGYEVNREAFLDRCRCADSDESE